MGNQTTIRGIEKAMDPATPSAYIRNDGSLDTDTFAEDIASIVSGYPDCDPDALLGWAARRLAEQASGDEAAPLAVGLYATRTYPYWYVRHAAVVRQMIDAVRAASEVFAAADCPHHEGDGHPGLDSTRAYTEELADLIPLLGDEHRWDEEIEDMEVLNAGPRDGWLCPGFLAGLAREILDDLRRAITRITRAPDTGHLDALYLHRDGRADIVRLTRDLGDGRWRDPKDPTGTAAVWAARRFIAGARPEERLPLLLLVCAVTRRCAWEQVAPAAVHVYREALATVDPAPLAAPCAHGEGHPTAWVPDRKRMALVRALHAPDAHAGELGDAAEIDQDAVRCPKYAAEQAREALDYSRRYLRLDEEEE
ncbi:hypothetical protein GCM10009799_22600 [Nocardiopsis rhodophaea]|uniref:Uncharacterized protein n=2 Tax=Nocardiopsis rhodophaea TaxID=280238 RepID=A0ABN2T093_9ACTN